MILGPIIGLVVGLAIFGLGMAKGIRSERGRPRAVAAGILEKLNRIDKGLQQRCCSKRNVRRYRTMTQRFNMIASCVLLQDTDLLGGVELFTLLTSEVVGVL